MSPAAWVLLAILMVIVSIAVHDTYINWNRRNR